MTALNDTAAPEHLKGIPTHLGLLTTYASFPAVWATIFIINSQTTFVTLIVSANMFATPITICTSTRSTYYTSSHNWNAINKYLNVSGVELCFSIIPCTDAHLCDFGYVIIFPPVLPSLKAVFWAGIRFLACHTHLQLPCRSCDCTDTPSRKSQS